MKRTILLHTSFPRRKGGEVVIALPGETLLVAEHDENDEVIAHNEVDLDVAKELVESGRAVLVLDEPPVLTGKTKAELLKIAADEEVTEATDKDGKTVPIAEATNAAIVEAIEAKRAARG